MLALMLTLPATLLGLVVLLAITSGLERRLAQAVRPAHIGTNPRHLPAPVPKRG